MSFWTRHYLFKFDHLRIIHGYGDGILKKSIREILKKYDFVKDFSPETEEHGGDGVTLVSLK
jgi:DNA mismatch repair protein MutS2